MQTLATQWTDAVLPFMSSVAPSKLCVSDEGYNLHAATTAGAAAREGREALLRYVLRPAGCARAHRARPRQPMRNALKKPFSDGNF